MVSKPNVYVHVHAHVFEEGIIVKIPVCIYAHVLRPKWSNTIFTFCTHVSFCVCARACVWPWTVQRYLDNIGALRPLSCTGTTQDKNDLQMHQKLSQERSRSFTVKEAQLLKSLAATLYKWHSSTTTTLCEFCSLPCPHTASLLNEEILDDRWARIRASPQPTAYEIHPTSWRQIGGARKGTLQVWTLGLFSAICEAVGLYCFELLWISPPQRSPVTIYTMTIVRLFWKDPSGGSSVEFVHSESKTADLRNTYRLLKRKKERWSWPTGVVAEEIPRVCPLQWITPASLGYPLSVFN